MRRGHGVLGRAEAMLDAQQPAPHGRKLDERQEEPAQHADEKPNTWEEITTYNNYYEFGTDKDSPADARAQVPQARRRGRWRSTASATRPAKYAPRGHPQGADARGAHLPAPLRRGVVDGDSVGRLPAVELHQEVRADVEGEVRRVHDAARSEQMPGVRVPVLDWPYVEGLRMDEAMHPLTILVVGLYGEVLPNQDGAPLRLVVPWKYGFKRVKSIVKIRFVEKQPLNTWQESAPQRVRLLREREPDGRSPALEPGDRAPHRRVLQAQDADVQRLRRSGREPVRGHGPEEELLAAYVAQLCAIRQPSDSGLKPRRVRRRRSVPFGSGWSGRRYTGNLSANPLSDLTQRNRRLDAAVPLHHARDHAAAPAHRLERARSGSAAWSASSRSSTARCTSSST